MTLLIKKILVLTSFLLIVSFAAFGEKSVPADACNVAKAYLARVNTAFGVHHLVGSDNYFTIAEGNELLAYVFRLEPQGFMVISAFDTDRPVIGFSLDDDIPGEAVLKTLPGYSVITGIARAGKYGGTLQHDKEYPSAAQDQTIYGPWVQTLWGQVNCHNNQGQLINVTNYYTPNHYAAGCVAISLATMLHYYRWPLVGEGFHQYYDGQGSSTGWYEADFGSTWYKWDLMLEKYNNQVSTDPQREAAGELAFHAAVSLDMDFEYNGSTSSVTKIPGTGSNYFRFHSFYKQENSTVFWPRLDKNIVEENPVILSVANNSGWGHSVICDGLWINDDEERFYHLNMGWWGSGNGWFQIQEDFNAGGYTIINGGVLDFIPKVILFEPQMPGDTNMFHLNWQFTHTIEANAYEVQHKVNNGSWVTITDTYQDTSILVVVENPGEPHYFRVRAKVNDEWYPSTWSNVVQLLITGTQELARVNNKVMVSPNPFHENVKIILGENDLRNVSLKVYTPEGKMVYRSEESLMHGEINIPALQWKQGIYLLDVTTGREHQILKIIKN